MAYLGHVISVARVAVDMEKIKAMLELWGFLGLIGYYRKFIANYALLARLLTDQLRKGSFGWNEYATAAFKKLKKAMTQPIVCSPPLCALHAEF